MSSWKVFTLLGKVTLVETQLQEINLWHFKVVVVLFVSLSFLSLVSMNSETL